jgi:hypothetical protein
MDGLASLWGARTATIWFLLCSSHGCAERSAQDERAFGRPTPQGGSFDEPVPVAQDEGDENDSEDDEAIEEYHPEHDMVGGQVGGTPMTEQDFADDLEAKQAEAAIAHDPAKWVAAIEGDMESKTVGLIVEFVADLGDKYGGHTNTARVKVIEQLRGPPVLAAEVEIVQTSPAGNGQPSVCGGLQWTSTRPVAVFANPIAEASYRVLMNFTKGAMGWAYQESDGRWRPPGAESLSTDALEGIGAAP